MIMEMGRTHRGVVGNCLVCDSCDTFFPSIYIRQLHNTYTKLSPLHIENIFLFLGISLDLKIMKGSLYSRHQWILLLLVLLVLCSHLTSAARMLEDDNKVVRGGLFRKNSVVEETEEDDTIDLMGVEHCGDGDGDGDGECIKRRMVAEAHLDYIYTQHHKP